MNIGIIGAGNIAKKMANTVNCLEEFCNYAVASRDIEKAKAFKLEFGFKKVYGNYEELLQDDNVELVYVATVHSTHYDIMKLCLQYNKPVICEKCFTTSLNDTIGIYRNFEDKKLFVTEALWTSYMPSRQIIDALLKDNVVGKNIVMHAQFRLPISQVERLKRKDLGGGSMMDLGIYPVSFVFRTLGFNYASCFVSDTQLNEYGADVKETIEFCYSNGAKAVCKADCISDRQTDVWIEGDEGKILIDSVTCPCHIEVYDKNGQVVKTIDCAPKFGGFEYELWSCKRAIDSGKTECHEWTHNDSIETSKIVEKVLNYANNIRE